MSLSVRLSPLLDSQDVISGKYNLEVGSAGLDRPLNNDQDFTKYQGYEVSCRLKIKDENNRAKYQGILTSHDEHNLHITLDDKTIINIAKSNINKVRLVINDKILNLNPNNAKKKVK